YFSSYEYFFPPHLHSFPTRRSSDLPICHGPEITPQRLMIVRNPYIARYSSTKSSAASLVVPYRERCPPRAKLSEIPAALTPNCRDRKSTRLNSSHRTISYAVFCLKK